MKTNKTTMRVFFCAYVHAKYNDFKGYIMKDSKEVDVKTTKETIDDTIDDNMFKHFLRILQKMVTNDAHVNKTHHKQ